MFQTVLPVPQLQARRVVMLCDQRDFLFSRRHGLVTSERGWFVDVRYAFRSTGLSVVKKFGEPRPTTCTVEEMHKSGKGEDGVKGEDEESKPGGENQTADG